MKSNRLRVVAVCGIRGSGKTTFCEWLEREKGFLHLDFDKLLCGNGDQLKLWMTEALQQGPTKFISTVFEREQPTVIDWGFPVTNLPIVRALRDQGVVIWWFDGNRKAARKAFADRGTVALSAFDTQLAAIESNWSKIREVVGGHILETVSFGPAHAKPEWISEQIFGRD